MAVHEGPMTTADPAGGHYAYTRTVKLTCTENGTKPAGCTTTFYTIDGTVPSFTEKFNATTKVTEYKPTGSTRIFIPTDPIPMMFNATLKFLSIDKAGNVGPMGEEKFEVTRGAGSGWIGLPMLILALMGLLGRFLRRGAVTPTGGRKWW